MTDRLHQLLQDEADGLAVPVAPVDAIVTAGRRRRTRSRWAAVTGAAAAAAVAAGLGVTLVGGPGPDEGRGDDVAASPAYAGQAAFAVGRTVYVGSSAEHRVTVEDDVRALYLTSAGVVVRSGRTPWTDGGGPSDYDLVAPDGSTRSLGIALGDVAPSADPSQPYLAWASGSGGRWTVHVLDVRTSEETTARVDGAFTWGGWEAPPVSLDGDTVYVGLDAQATAVLWRTGSSRPAAGLPGSQAPDVRDGLSVSGPPLDRRYRATGPAQVVVADSGEVVRELDVAADAFLGLSPDGRYVKVTDQDTAPGAPEPETVTVVDVRTGTTALVDGLPHDYGWTPDGGLVRVTREEASVCSPGGRECRVVAQDLGPGEITIGGSSYES